MTSDCSHGNVIGTENARGESDAAFHEEIVAGVDDYPLRLESARRAVRDFGVTVDQAEKAYNVQLEESHHDLSTRR